MTAFLVDTHVLVWSAIGSRRLSPRAVDLLSDPGIDVFVSAVSIAEIVIKQRLGKLELPRSPLAVMEALGMSELALTGAHAEAVEHLPLLHHDPFDRWLVAQAVVEGLTLVSADRQIARYPVEVIDPTV